MNPSPNHANNRNNLLNEEFISFEKIVEEKLPMGRYQYLLFILLALIFITDGIEMANLSLILPILKKEWDIRESLQGLLGSVLFFGLFLGSLLAGFSVDKIGRKKALEYISILQFVLGVYSSFLSNVYIFLLIRGLFGFLLGFSVPLVPTLLTENISSEKRGKFTVLINCSFSLGSLIATIIAWFCLDNMISGNWRLMLLIGSFPSLLVYIGTRRYLKESPRYIILSSSVENGIKVLNEMIELNNENKPFYKTLIAFDFYNEYKINKKEFIFDESKYFNQNEDMKKLIKWKEYVILYNDEEIGDEKEIYKKENNYNEKFLNKNDFENSKNNYKLDSFKKKKTNYEKYLSMFRALFNEKYKFFTIGLWLTWFAINFTMYGLVFIIPFFLNAWDKQNQQSKIKLDGMKSLILTTLGEGLSGVLAYFLVDSRFGRKYSLFYCQIISSMFILFSYFVPLDYGDYLVLFLALARLFGKVCFAVIYPYTAEIYHTSLRTLGIGASSAVGRIGACIMPFISIKLFYINMWSPFLLFFFIAFTGIIGTFIIPYDTLRKDLDVHK